MDKQLKDFGIASLPTVARKDSGARMGFTPTCLPQAGQKTFAMTKNMKVLILFCVSLLISGCATTPIPMKNKNENTRDVQTAVGSVVGSIRGDKVRVKYCPVCGKHYSANVEACPKDLTSLKELED